MRISIVAVCEWDVNTNECEVFTFSDEPKLRSLRARSNKSPADAFRNLVKAMEEHDVELDGPRA